MYYDGINIRDRNDLAKSFSSKEYMICHYRFFNHGVKFQDHVWNSYHDLSMLCIDISDIALMTVKNVDYRCIIHNISKSEAINLFESAVLEKPVYI